MSEPVLSVIVNFFNMRREASRSLLALSARYQRDVGAQDYEVIAIDNGSTQPLRAEDVAAFGPNFHYRFHATASKSPVGALNEAIRECRGRYVMVMIDGAHIVTPGVIALALKTFAAFEHPFVATVALHLGPGAQDATVLQGYDQAVEDKLLADVDWKADGYRLFKISGSFADENMGWFGHLVESNCFALRKDDYQELGGLDERFQTPGGGLANLDLFANALRSPKLTYVVLLGEASFHQIHGSTNAIGPAQKAAWQMFTDEYAQIRGRKYVSVARLPVLFGGIPPNALEFTVLSASTGLRWWADNLRGKARST
jgi:glycosyltransferase involved in cell wall biosynthesis